MVAGAAAALAGAATTIKGLHDSLSGDDNGDSADLDGVVKSLEDANSQLDAFSVAMSSTVPDAVSSLAASFTPVVELFGSGLPEAVSASAESASGFLTAVTELGAALSTVFGAASEEIGDTADAFTVMTGEIVGSLEELSAEIPSVFEAVSEGGTAAAGELDASFTSVIDTIEAKWSALLSFVTSAYSSISSMASAAQTMADTVSGVKAGLSELTTANAPSLPASSSFGLDNNSWLGHAAELAGRGLERIGEFSVGTVERAQSALGKIEQNVVNTILLNSNQPSSAPTQITVNLDGREMASALYEPLINEGKRSGRSLYSK